MTCDDVRMRLTLLTGRELDRVALEAAEAHLAACAECRAWRDADARLDALLRTVSEEAPGSGFRTGVMARVRAEQAPVPRTWWRQPVFVLQGIAAAVALLFLLSPSGAEAVRDVSAVAAEASASSSVPVAPSLEELGAEISAIDVTGDAAAWVVALCAAALAGNLLALSGGARRRLGALLPCFAMLAILLGATATEAAQPGDEAWRSLRETSDFVRIVLIGVVLAAGAMGAAAIGIAVRALAPSLVARADSVAAARSGVYQFLVGLFNFVILLVLAVLLLRIDGPRRFAGLLILVAMTAVASLGVAAWVRRIGTAILASADRGRSDLGRDVAGGLALAVAILCPFAGQVFFLALLVLSFGTGLLGLILRRSSTRPEKHETNEERRHGENDV